MIQSRRWVKEAHSSQEEKTVIESSGHRSRRVYWVEGPHGSWGIEQMEDRRWKREEV